MERRDSQVSGWARRKRWPAGSAIGSAREGHLAGQAAQCRSGEAPGRRGLARGSRRPRLSSRFRVRDPRPCHRCPVARLGAARLLDGGPPPIVHRYEPHDGPAGPSRLHPGKHSRAASITCERARRVIDGEAPCGPTTPGSERFTRYQARRAPAHGVARLALIASQ